MEIEVEKKHVGAVIKLKGNITGIPDDSKFNNAIQNLIAEKNKHIVVDFGEISYVNSTGLGIIVRGYHAVKAVGGNIKLASPNKKMQNLIELTKLDTIFDVYESVDEALRSFE